MANISVSIVDDDLKFHRSMYLNGKNKSAKFEENRRGQGSKCAEPIWNDPAADLKND